MAHCIEINGQSRWIKTPTDFDKQNKRGVSQGLFKVGDRVSDRTKNKSEFSIVPDAKTLQETYWILLDNLDGYRKLYFANMKYLRGMGEFVKWIHIKARGGKYSGFYDQWSIDIDYDRKKIDSIHQQIRNLKYYARLYNIVLEDSPTS